MNKFSHFRMLKWLLVWIFSCHFPLPPAPQRVHMYCDIDVAIHILPLFVCTSFCMPSSCPQW